MRLLALLLALLAGGCAEAHPNGFAEYALRLDHEGGGICSGTAVGPNVLLTAQHCTDSGAILAINGQPARALKIVKDGRDHVLVRVTMQFKKWARVGSGPLTGDRVRWLGNPAGNDRVYREGYVARNWTDEVWLEAPAFGGDSGAGTFCADGRVCGVVSAGKVWVRGNFSFAVTVLYPLGFTAKDWQAIK